MIVTRLGDPCSTQSIQVGGGHVHMCKALAQAYPNLQFIAQGSPSVIESTWAPDVSITSKIRFMEHGFFAEKPIKDTDLYLL